MSAHTDCNAALLPTPIRAFSISCEAFIAENTSYVVGGFFVMFRSVIILAFAIFFRLFVPLFVFANLLWVSARKEKRRL